MLLICYYISLANNFIIAHFSIRRCFCPKLEIHHLNTFLLILYNSVYKSGNQGNDIKRCTILQITEGGVVGEDLEQYLSISELNNIITTELYETNPN
jgi:hypothetical protein